MPAMKLSVVIPVYNEVDNIREILKRVQATGAASEIIVVDDGSVDGSRAVLAKLKSKKGLQGPPARAQSGQGRRRADRHSGRPRRRDPDPGRRPGVQPSRLPRAAPALLDGDADVVYGSGFLGGPRRAVMFWHMIANQLLTLMTNVLYNTILTDMETGYKVFRREVVTDMVLRSRGFDFEPEFTAKVLKRHYRIFEVPISFNPRDYSEGKKIKLQDAFVAVWTCSSTGSWTRRAVCPDEEDTRSRTAAGVSSAAEVAPCVPSGMPIAASAATAACSTTSTPSACCCRVVGRHRDLDGRHHAPALQMDLLVRRPAPGQS